jgi:hypothetical protein
MPPLNRCVAVLTPVFGAAAAIGSTWLAKHFPGLPTPSSAELTAIEVAGFTSATAAALHWLRGHQLWEARVKTVEHEAEQVVNVAETVDPGLVKALEAIVKAEVGKLEAKLPKGAEVITRTVPAPPVVVQSTQAPPVQ